MAVFSLTDAFCYCEEYDFTTQSNNVALSSEAAALDVTTFNSGGWTELTGGLKSVNFNMGGFWDAAADGQAVDNQSFADLGTTDQVFTVGPVETENQACFMFRGMKSQYTLGGAVGEVAPFSLTAGGANTASSEGVIRGRLAKAKGVVSATGALGTGLNLGQVTSSQYLYAAFHVFSAGTSITVTLQSDDNSDFTTPVVRATIGPLTTTGGTWVTRIPGAITDTHYRFVVTTITGSFTVAGSIGKQ